MNLKHLTDKVLHEDTKRLAHSERELTVKILHHLKEIDRRRLYSDHGCTSLHHYCVKELGYSEGSAHRRIVSARLLNEIPAIEEKIESGALNLMKISALSNFFRDQEVVNSEKKKEIIAKVEGLSTRECELKLIELSEKPLERKHCLWIGDSTMGKIKDYRNLKGTNESYEEIIAEALGSAFADLERAKFKLVKHPRKETTSMGRGPTASITREVYLRDKICVKCGSKFGLQIDHVKPFSLGGKTTTDNLRLLCFNCNQRERIRQRL